MLQKVEYYRVFITCMLRLLPSQCDIYVLHLAAFLAVRIDHKLCALAFALAARG